MKDDPLAKSLRDIKSDIPEPRRNLTEEEKDALIVTLGGPRTVRSILKAKETLPQARIPFLFSSLDSHAVLEVLVNDMTSALKRCG